MLKFHDWKVLRLSHIRLHKYFIKSCTLSTAFDAQKADLQPYHTIHTHKLSLHTCRKAKEQEKLKNKEGGGCGQPNSSGECLHTEQRGWVQPKRPHQLTSGTVLMAVVLTL